MAFNLAQNQDDLDVSEVYVQSAADDTLALCATQQKCAKKILWVDMHDDDEREGEVSIEFNDWFTESGSRKVQDGLNTPESRKDLKAWHARIIKFLDMLLEVDAVERSNGKLAKEARFVKAAHHRCGNYAVQKLMVALKAAIAHDGLEEVDRTVLQERSSKLFQEIQRNAAHLVRHGSAFHVMKCVVDVYLDNILPIVQRFASNPQGIFESQPGSSVIKHIIANGTEEMRDLIRTTADSFKPNPKKSREKHGKKFLQEIQEELAKYSAKYSANYTADAIWGIDMAFDASPYQFDDTHEMDHPFEPPTPNSKNPYCFKKNEPQTPWLPSPEFAPELELNQADMNF